MLNFGAQRDLATVLLIDDDLISREVLATLLTLSGYTIHTAADGAAALGMLAAGRFEPDVILMDAQMPGLSGIALIGELRARSQAKLFAMSGSNTTAEVAAVADGFLLKPFGANALEKLLNQHAPQATPAPAPVLDAGLPVVSAETLAQFRAMMPEEAVREIYAAIVADLAKRLPALGMAIANGDTAEIRRIGHAIKGGCGMAGALQAARLGAMLEADALESQRNHLDNSAALLRDLRAAVRSLERMLVDELPA
jgi:CheY-like chemotaxis protein